MQPRAIFGWLVGPKICIFGLVFADMKMEETALEIFYLQNFAPFVFLILRKISQGFRFDQNAFCWLISGGGGGILRV